MKTITKQSDLGGILSLYLIPSHLISSISAETVSLVIPDALYEICCATDSIQHNSSISENKAGILYLQTITAILPGTNIDGLATLHSLSYYKLVAILQSSSGSYYRIGNKSESLKLSLDYFSGKETQDRNGYTFTLKGLIQEIPRTVDLPVLS